MSSGMRGWAARLIASAAFLAAVTVAVLLVRAGLRENDPVVPSAEPAAATVAAPGRRFHLVRRGDTLDEIAARYGTTVARLRRLNPGLDPVGLRVGARVQVR